MTEDGKNIGSGFSALLDRVFPFDEELVPFVLRCLPKGRGTILDIGSAIGRLANALGREGNEVIGVDQDHEMVGFANSRFRNSRVSFQLGNLTSLDRLFSPDSFDCVTCFGNTLVNLPCFDSISALFRQIFSILREGGVFIGQIRHFNRIISLREAGFPLIESEGIRFERRYLFQENDRCLVYETTLRMPAHEESFIQRFSQYPLSSEELNQSILAAGFTSLLLFSDLRQSPFTGESPDLFFACEKPECPM